jgi:hypothetical protein
MKQLLVSGRPFEWDIATGTSEFTQFARLGDQDAIDVLRITEPGSGFDIAIPVLSGHYSDGLHRYLGPLLVLGDQFPSAQQPVEPGILIELRPKLRPLAPDEPNATTVERIVQWCKSSSFKSARVNSSGGRWVGYGRASDA